MNTHPDNQHVPGDEQHPIRRDGVLYSTYLRMPPGRTLHQWRCAARLEHKLNMRRVRAILKKRKPRESNAKPLLHYNPAELIAGLDAGKLWAQSTEPKARDVRLNYKTWKALKHKPESPSP